MQVSMIRRKYRALRAILDERQRRLWAAEVQALGRGGLAAVVRATGLARTTVWRGFRYILHAPDHVEIVARPERVEPAGPGVGH